MAAYNYLTGAGGSSQASIPAALRGKHFEEIKKLYFRSRNVKALALLLSIGFLILLISAPSLLTSETGEQTFKPKFVFGYLAFYGLTMIGIWMRTTWGRVLGILWSLMSLLSVPIGTIIGICCLIAFICAGELFGGDRISHKELKEEYLRQKARRA